MAEPIGWLEDDCTLASARLVDDSGTVVTAQVPDGHRHEIAAAIATAFSPGGTPFGFTTDDPLQVYPSFEQGPRALTPVTLFDVAALPPDQADRHSLFLYRPALLVYSIGLLDQNRNQLRIGKRSAVLFGPAENGQLRHSRLYFEQDTEQDVTVRLLDNPYLDRDIRHTRAIGHGGQWMTALAYGDQTFRLVAGQTLGLGVLSHLFTIISTTDINWVTIERTDPSSPSPELLSQQRQQLITGALSKLVLKTAEIAQLNQELASGVQQARELGISWTEIGKRLGVTGASARQRFDAEAKEAHRQKIARYRDRADS